jgi:hypothetical protein
MIPTTILTLYVGMPPQQPGPYALPSSHAEIEAELQEYLAKWWLVKMGATVRVMLNSAEVVEA